MSTTNNDLTKEAPRSPRLRLGGYAILSRIIDKGRALLGGDIGEYHYDCPLDNSLFSFKGVTGSAFKEQIAAGASDEQLTSWLSANGTAKTPAEITAWSDAVEAATFHGDPERGEWFDGEVSKLGLDPARATLFDFLEADDKASFAA